MMNTDKWNKCAEVIHRLSSRVKNEQSQSAMIDNCNTMIPLCIEKSFYQYKSDTGQGCCVEVCGNCSDSIKLSNDVVKNTNISTWEKPICDPKLDRHFLNPIDSYRHQFTSSRIFDNKSEYIEYIVTNVLRQVVNHIPFDSLYQLSCYLSKNIEDILRNTDMDSDRLIRILVADVLQCYGANTGQLTDWYAFANLIKPLLSPTKAKSDDNEKVNDTRNKIPLNPKKLPKDKKSSQRILNSHIKNTTPVPSMVKNNQSSKSIAFSNIVSPSTDTNILSVNGTPSAGLTSEIMSTMNSMTPMSIHSKEEFTPIGTTYQSKSKSDQTFVFDTSNKIDHHESLPFRGKSTNRSSSNGSETQHQIVSDSHSHVDHKSNKSSDQSSSNDCVLTIHHKHKHKRTHNHHHEDNHHTTTASFDTPLSRSLSSHTSVPIKESIQKYKQMSSDASSVITDEQSARTTSPQNVNLKSANLFNERQMLLCKLLGSSDNTTKHLHQTDNPSYQLSSHEAVLLSPNNESKLSRLMNEVEIHNPQLPSSTDLNKSNLLSTDHRGRMNTNLTSLNKKVRRISHYLYMLVDFD